MQDEIDHFDILAASFGPSVITYIYYVFLFFDFFLSLLIWKVCGEGGLNMTLNKNYFDAPFPVAWHDGNGTFAWFPKNNNEPGENEVLILSLCLFLSEPGLINEMMLLAQV